MSEWSHPICMACWFDQRGNDVPYRVASSIKEICCWCGNNTFTGVYVRADPDDLPFHKVHEVEEPA